MIGLEFRAIFGGNRVEMRNEQLLVAFNQAFSGGDTNKAAISVETSLHLPNLLQKGSSSIFQNEKTDG
jgi:hypothetical protein